MPYYEKRIKSGSLYEVIRYHSTDKPTAARGRKGTESSEKQMRANLIRTEKELVRVIHCNFDGKRGDQFITLTFKEEINGSGAKREWTNFVRRVQRYLRKQGMGVAFKYVCIIEKQAQWHIHAIINYIPLPELTRLWGRGKVHASILEDYDDYRNLARYLTGTTKEAEGNELCERAKYTRRWSCSQNLKRPEVTVVELPGERAMHEEPATPQGYVMRDCNITVDSFGYLKQYSIFRAVPRRTRKPPNTPIEKKRNLQRSVLLGDVPDFIG